MSLLSTALRKNNIGDYFTFSLPTKHSSSSENSQRSLNKIDQYRSGFVCEQEIPSGNLV